MDIVTIRSPGNENDIYDYIAIQLMSSGMGGTPLVLAIVSSRKSLLVMSFFTYKSQIVRHSSTKLTRTWSKK